MIRLLICGIPGSGKSTYAKWLHEVRGFEYFEFDSTPEMPDITTLGDRDVVFEWGYNPDISQDDVRQMISQGWQYWWFDGDRSAALQSYKSKRRIAGFSEPQMAEYESLWQMQLERINRRWEDIDALFKGHQLKVVSRGPKHLESEKVFDLMFEATTDSSPPAAI